MIKTFEGNSMKRVHIEPWTTKEKLCLASAVLHSGDQNWMSVSRILRMYGEQNRPLDWYSQKQCAVQYECLLNNAGTPKRKKRSEKGVETVDIPGEAIVRKLTQERIDELKMMIAEDKADYLRIKKLQEEVDSGNLDDRLDEVELQMEEEIRRDKERNASRLEAKKADTDLSPRLGSLANRNKILGQDAESNDSSMEVDVKSSPTPTSPLLTSLLQSPSPSLLHRSSSSTPTISSLLHSSPSIPRVHDSPTLSKLLESPTSQTSGVQNKAATEFTTIETPTVSKEMDTLKMQLTIDQDESAITDVIEEMKINRMTDVLEPSSSEEKEKKPNVVRKLDLETSPQDLEKEEQSSLNHTQDSDTLEEQLENEIELDSQAVDMIVMGPNQSAVIAVHHDISNEHVEEEGVGAIKEELPADELIKEEPCEEVTEESIVLMNEEEMSKPVEDALKMINDATIVVAEPEAIVEIETPATEEVRGDFSNTEEPFLDNEVKDIVGEEQVITEEVVTEEIKDLIIEAIQTEMNTEEEIVLEETKHDTKEENQNEEREDVQVDGDDAVGEQERGVLDVVAGILSVVEVNEKKDEQLEEVNVVTTENRPKQVGRRRKSSKDTKEKVTIKMKEEVSIASAKEQPAFISLEKEPVQFTSTEKELSPSSLVPSISVESKLVEKELVESTPLKKGQAEITLSVKEPAMSTPVVEKPVESISEKEKQITSSNELVAMNSVPKEPLPSTSSAKEIPLSLPPPENVISDFKVPRSDTPSTTDEDNEPIAYIAKRGKPKRNSGVDSKPNSPSPQSFDEGSKEFRAWKKSIMLVYNRLSTHKYASIFLRPITNERARGYHTVIHRPMDLSTLKKNIETGHIRTTVEFQRDVMLMFQNAIMYNNTNTEIFEMASVMQRECIQHFQLMVEAMGEGVPWRESAMNNEKTTRTRVKTEDLPPSRKRAHNSTSEEKPVVLTKRKKMSIT